MILPPEACPCCDSKLQWKNDQLYCINPDCGQKQYKSVEHFTKILKIKGLGPSTIEKLRISDFDSIYNMSVEYMSEVLQSEKIAVKLYDEIQKSKQQPLNNVLPALGIPLIGKTATDKLSKVCDDIFDISEDTCKQAGLGAKATANILKALDEEDYFCYLPMDMVFNKTSSSSTESLGVICISGKLNSYSTKQEATKILEEIGYIVKPSLTKDVTILVNESGKETQKTQKAIENGILIIENLKNFIEDRR